MEQDRNIFRFEPRIEVENPIEPTNEQMTNFVGGIVTKTLRSATNSVRVKFPLGLPVPQESEIKKFSEEIALFLNHTGQDFSVEVIPWAELGDQTEILIKRGSQ